MKMGQGIAAALALALAAASLLAAPNAAVATPGASATVGPFWISGKVFTDAIVTSPLVRVGAIPQDPSGVADEVEWLPDKTFRILVPPGVYLIQVTHPRQYGDVPGWADTFLGDVAFKSQSTLVHVTDSHIDVGVIHMIRAGAISGTFTVPDGVEPTDVAYTTYSWNPDEGVWETNGTQRLPSTGNQFRTWQLPPGPTLMRFSAWKISSNIRTTYLDGARVWWETSPVEVVADSEVVAPEVQITVEPRAVIRLAGGDRFATAVAVSQHGYPTDSIPAEGVDTVFIASGVNFPDALSAGPAAAGRGPVLLVPTSGIPGAVRDELDRLRPQRIVIAGGPAAVSLATEVELQQIAPTERIGGANRYAVSRSIASSEFGSARIAVIATGSNFPDALAVGPFAAVRGAPVILVAPGPHLDAATRQLLVDLGVQSVYIAGGTGSVSSGIEADLWTVQGVERVSRLGGQNRYETAAMFSSLVGYPLDQVFVALGGNFPDALAGTWLGGYWGDSIVLALNDCITWPGFTAFSSGASMIVLGGPGVLSPAIEQFAECPS